MVAMPIGNMKISYKNDVYNYYLNPIEKIKQNSYKQLVSGKRANNNYFLNTFKFKMHIL